jgi:class 3 adenylate cyclase
MNFFRQLRFKIALMAGLLLAGLSFLTLTFVSRAIDRRSTDAIRAELGNTARVFNGLLQERRNSMMAQANVLADSVQFKTALDDKVQDPATLADVAAEKKAELGLGLFQVAGRQGALLASLAGSDAFPQPRPGRDAKPADAVFAKAVDSEVPADAFGVMTVAGGLFETYTRPIIIRDQVLGALRIGFSLDDTLAGALKEQTGSEVAFVGFTSLSERLSPTEVVAMLNDYYTRMIDVLFEHDGTLDKTIGDAIMAVFGAPVADPDAVAKALHTALDMRQALRGFNDDRRARGQEAIEIGIGINVGNVVAGNLGSVRQLSYTVIGDEVNLASRLCGSAKPGQILVSEAVQRKAKWSFDFVALDPSRVKNVSQPVQVYELKGVRSAAAPGFA